MDRKQIRLNEYDYCQNGAYFLTICTDNRNCILSTVWGDSPKLTKIGQIAERELLKVESHYDNIKIDKYVIMPNHIHLIIIIKERINPFPTKKYDISNVIGKYKAAVTRSVGDAFMHPKKSIWQRSFYDHVIRNKEDYLSIWNYIDTNPQKWQEDKYYN